MVDKSMRYTVLIVDDTKMEIDVMNEILHDNYNVKFALDGPKALEIAVKEPLPDIILLDVMMPGMNGYEVCLSFKQNPLIASIPVIFVTAFDDLVGELRGFDVGGVDYILKPVIPEIVLARVKTHIELHEYRKNR